MGAAAVADGGSHLAVIDPAQRVQVIALNLSLQQHIGRRCGNVAALRDEGDGGAGAASPWFDHALGLANQSSRFGISSGIDGRRCHAPADGVFHKTQLVMPLRYPAGRRPLIVHRLGQARHKIRHVTHLFRAGDEIRHLFPFDDIENVPFPGRKVRIGRRDAIIFGDGSTHRAQLAPERVRHNNADAMAMKRPR